MGIILPFDRTFALCDATDDTLIQMWLNMIQARNPEICAGLTNELPLFCIGYALACETEYMRPEPDDGADRDFFAGLGEWIDSNYEPYPGSQWWVVALLIARIAYCGDAAPEADKYIRAAIAASSGLVCPEWHQSMISQIARLSGFDFDVANPFDPDQARRLGAHLGVYDPTDIYGDADGDDR